jgi:RNA polymerase sigma factor for flagellar operon FliA
MAWAVAEEAFEQQFDAWRSAQDEVARQTIVLHYFPLCAIVAQGVARKLPPHVDRDELASVALMGLYAAIDTFDPAKGSSFWKYAIMRMRNTVIDGIRAEDWAPRSLRKRQKELEGAEAELEKGLHRKPTDSEVAMRTGWTVAQIRSTRQEVAASWHVSLEERCVEETHGEEPVSKHSENSEYVETDYLRLASVEAIERMDEVRQIVMALRYYEEMSFAEIALMIGAPKSAVEQAHNRAVGEVWDRVREVAAV